MVNLQELIAKFEKELKLCSEIWTEEQWPYRTFVENLTLPEAELILEALKAQIRDKVYLVMNGKPGASCRDVLRVAKTPEVAERAKEEEVTRKCASFPAAELWYKNNTVIEAMELES